MATGKSIVGKVFKCMDYPLYVADTEAKKLMNEDTAVQKAIISLLGEEAFCNNKLNREFISKQIFQNNDLREQLNSIVHPAVRNHFEDWCAAQEQEIIFYESALVFETNSENRFSRILLVTADLETKIKRLTKRDQQSRDLINKKISSQMSDEEKSKKADFIINNNDNSMILPQIATILKSIKKHG